MMLDQVLPVYDFRETHGVAVRAPSNRIFAAIKEVTLKELPVFRLLFEIRTLPARLAGRGGRGLKADQTLFEWARQSGFALLAERVDQELVLGRIGQPWKLAGGLSPSIEDVQEFLELVTPGYVKVAANFFLRETLGDGGTQVSTETRIHALDPTTRRKFAIYWRFIYPGSALIRKEWLSIVQRHAEG